VVGNDEGVDENPDKETEDEENSEEVVEEYIPVVSFSVDIIFPSVEFYICPPKDSH
jgi:hypothetical protein